MEGEVFAATKLGVPALRSGLAARDDLVAVLAAEGAHRLTLVSAPAGSGKTTLVTQWAASAAERRPFAWLSLDPEDSDPVRFWDGILRALAHVWPGAGERAAAALRAPGTSLTRTVVPLVVNEVAEHADPVVLVLDDLHVVEDPEAVRAL